ncbi:hypothetical protein NGTWS0302_16630 [Mycolicibacterium cyprinidarum]|uniref:Uncharacterized protein n=1 Tax=Mycolicibacterium cyprinidarum TaxID=2860311 RepID=A0ABQ4V8G9_9MYCO|nr:hypothetical protein NGTWS1803_14320 [Mycolicibacterium sp. NGTWS1803]GJF09931.1 hypothetical protein NGTWS1702_34270 [Mycolicibacterium sp. NGTWSNA01]GJF18445.1 hypothetical protein NGTWS0302_16630 [Mycolicibacterium sp. NGTWS0302]
MNNVRGTGHSVFADGPTGGPALGGCEPRHFVLDDIKFSTLPLLKNGSAASGQLPFMAQAVSVVDGVNTPPRVFWFWILG